ncbi:MAG: hypothetical protein Q8M07_25235 [Prosthecobacter sp.]|nr:hypothetical protein [Prosthecobacter sp.]
MKPEPHEPEHFPAFKNWDECLIHARDRQDDFFPVAFLIEAWVGDVNCVALEHYAENKIGHRQLQTGTAWESWKRFFGSAKPDEWPHMLQCFGRFSRCDTPESEVLAKLNYLMALEDQHGAPVSRAARLSKMPVTITDPDEMLRKMRYWFQRLSEWLEAMAHWQAHMMATLAPKALQPTHEQRELFQVGLIQRNYASLNQHGKDWWQFRHQSLSEQFQGSKELGLIGKAQSNEKWGNPKRPQIDELTIHWWPLLVRHHWTDRDMRLLMRGVVDQPDQYPLKEDKEFADYRQKILGLKKDRSKQDKSAPDGKPTGWKVALAMVNRLPV